MLDSTDHEQDPATRDLRARLVELRARLNPEKPEPLHKRPKLRLIQGGKAGLLAPWFALLDHVKEHAVATVTVAATVPLLLVGPTMSLPEHPDPLLTEIGVPAFAEESPDAFTANPPAVTPRISAIRPRSEAAQVPPEHANPTGAAPLANVVAPLTPEIPITTAPAAAQIVSVLEPSESPDLVTVGPVAPAPIPQPVQEPVDEPAPAPEPAPEPTTPPAPEPEALPVQERVAGCVEQAKGGTVPDCAGLVPASR